MKNTDFEARMRSFEYFHSLKLPPEAWTVIRVDGRSFTRFTNTSKHNFERPFDQRFSNAMVEAAFHLLESLHGIYAYTESDEISVLFPPEWDLFDREVEKLVSVSASIPAAILSRHFDWICQFDSRIWIGLCGGRVVDYFRWRQADALRCCLNGWCYWTLRKEGKSVGEATKILEHKDVAFKNELLFQRGINFNDVPLWQRRGIGCYWEWYQKEGYNPIKQEKVLADRRRIVANRELPTGDDYKALLRGVGL